LARRLPSWALERYIECSDNIRPVLSHVLVTVLATPKQRNTSWLATCVTIPNCGELNVLFCYKAAELHVHALFWDLHMPIHMLNIHLNTHSSSPQALVSKVCVPRQLNCIQISDMQAKDLYMAHVNTWLSVWVCQDEMALWP